MFRRLYWILEEMQPSGASSILGVFTSIPDLQEEGVKYLFEHKIRDFRLSLTTLDHAGPLKGVWRSFEISTLMKDVQAIAGPSEISTDELESLARALSTTAPL